MFCLGVKETLCDHITSEFIRTCKFLLSLCFQLYVVVLVLQIQASAIKVKSACMLDIDYISTHECINLTI